MWKYFLFTYYIKIFANQTSLPFFSQKPIPIFVPTLTHFFLTPKTTVARVMFLSRLLYKKKVFDKPCLLPLGSF